MAFQDIKPGDMFKDEYDGEVIIVTSLGTSIERRNCDYCDIANIYAVTTPTNIRANGYKKIRWLYIESLLKATHWKKI